MENVLEKINQAGLKLLATMTPEETFTIIVNEAIELVNAEFGTIFLLHGDTLVRVHASHAFFFKIKVRKDGFVQEALRKNNLVVNNVEKVAKVHPIVKEMGIQSIVLIPLSHEGESIGVLALHSKTREHFSKKQIGILRLFGSMASMAIKKAQAYDETKKALEIRDMFISMAAHELRTPLTSISGYIQLLYSKLANHTGVEGKWIRELYEENKRMMNLVKELLEVNRLKTGKIQFTWQECSIVSIMKEAIQDVQKDYPEREIFLDNKIPENADQIIGDAGKLIKVFTNIIDNAVKYSTKPSKVTISIAQKAGVQIVSVKDLGRGIEEKDIERIFEGHHKAESGEEGMGIGLYFVESVIRQHRGAISVKSKVKKGTTFEIRMPRAKYGR